VEELEATAGIYNTSGLRAIALQARGALLLAEGRLGEALATLRSAIHSWQDLEAPYEVARIRLLVARAFEGLGDREAAALERDAAREAFARLGVRDAEPSAAPVRTGPLGELTGREYEVLQLAARGMSNGDIALALVLSVRTVERHLSTIYEKLGLEGRNARAAAVSLMLRDGASPATT
jgi:DNA-binding NarL/FixJ family response regulator